MRFKLQEHDERLKRTCACDGRYSFLITVTLLYATRNPNLSTFRCEESPP